MRQPPTLTGCREYQGSRLPSGYGTLYVKGRGSVLLHRWVWEQINGPIPEGMVVMHLCDNPSCFLYAHLRLGTYADNMADAWAKGRMTGRGRRPSEVCQYGHPMSRISNGHARCRTCSNAYKRQWDERNKERRKQMRKLRERKSES